MSQPDGKAWKTIQDAWIEFELRCIPPNAGPNQRFAQKATFFAGFQACMLMNMNIACDDNLTEEQQARRMSDLERELFNFGITIVGADTVMGYRR